MKKKLLKIGWVLVLEEIISRKQLDKALSVQKLHPTKSMGEIVSKLYGVPEGKIESIFVKKILVPAITRQLYEELKKAKNVKKSNIKKYIPEILVNISRFQRNIKSAKEFTLESTGLYLPTGQKDFISTIDCYIENIFIIVKPDKMIEFKDVSAEYNVQNQTISWDNPAVVMEAKVKLNQILKKNS